MKHRRTRLKLAAGLVVLTCYHILPLPAGIASAAEPAVTHDWPSYLGGNNAFGETSGVKLIDDMSKVKLLWESEEKGIGFGKAVSSAMRDGFAPGTGLPPSGEASPIVAGGLLIQAYFLPCGDAYDAQTENAMGAKFREFKKFALIAADDVVIAIDAATGKTKWKQVFANKGINTGAGKRGGWAVTPCAADGRVFAMGTTGRLYALELATGRLLWESNIGKQHEWLEKLKKDGLANKRLASKGYNFRPYGILVCADGVLLAPDWAGGLLGLDVVSGKQLWHMTERTPITSGYNAPVPITIGGTPYLAAINYLGEMRLIDLKTGKILWTHALKSQHLTQPVAGEELLVVFDPHPKLSGDTIGKSKDPNAIGVLAGYRLTESGAQRVWVLPDDYMVALHLDCGPRRKMAARNGLIYHVCDKATEIGVKPSNSERHLVIVSEKDGKIIKESPVGGWSPYLWGDRLITVTDIQHRPRAADAEIWQMYDADPQTFRALGSPWHVNGNPPIHYAVGGYELPVLEPFADGLFFQRVWGGFRCYDLRPSK